MLQLFREYTTNQTCVLNSLCNCVFLTRTLIKFSRFPDEDAGEIPMAFIVRKPGSNLNEAQIIDFVAKQVMLFLFSVWSW